MHPGAIGERPDLEYTHALLAAAGELAGARTYAEVTRVALVAARESVGADTAGIWLLDDTGQWLDFHDAQGIHPFSRTQWARIPLSFPGPAPDAVRNRQTVWLTSGADVRARYPEIAARSPAELADAAVICSPLQAGGAVLGTLVVTFRRRTVHYDPGVARYFEGLARHAAGALERARLLQSEQDARKEAENARSRAERAQRRLAYLADAGRTFAASLDVGSIARAVTRHAVPVLADCCALYLAEPAEDPPLAFTCDDPRMLAAHREIAARWGPPFARTVLETRRPVLLQEVTDRQLATTATSPEHLEALRRIGLRSYLAVPLITAERLIGVLHLCRGASQPAYEPEDLALADEVARRAAVALDHAELYARTTEAVRARDDFLSMASHELRTPLTTLTLQSRATLRSFDAPADFAAQRRRAEIVDRQVARLQSLVDGLVDVTRLAAGKLDLAPEPLDASEVAADVVERMRSEHPEGPDIHLRAQTSQLVADRLRLDQVLTNLVSNAIKYGRGEAVEVRVRPSGDEVHVEVEDRGIGIAPEDQDRIFGRFERAASRHHYGGLGLGLWIAAQIVEAMRGVISVRSELGRGSTFTVRLPAAQDLRS